MKGHGRSGCLDSPRKTESVGWPSCSLRTRHSALFPLSSMTWPKPGDHSRSAAYPRRTTPTDTDHGGLAFGACQALRLGRPALNSDARTLPTGKSARVHRLTTEMETASRSMLPSGHRTCWHQVAYAQLTFGFHMANMPLGLGRHAQMCSAQTCNGRFCIIGTPRIVGGVDDAGTSLNGMM